MKLSKLVMLILTLTFTLQLYAADPIEVNILTDEGYPPYAYKDDATRSAAGIYIDMLKIAFSRMDGYKVTMTPVPWKRGLTEIENGDAFGLLPPYYNRAKRPWIWPYSLPLLDERVTVYCKEHLMKNSLRPKWPEDYYTLVMGINSGFAFGGDKFREAVKDGKIKLEEAKTTTQNLLKLTTNKIDCYMNDRISTLWELAKLIKEGTIKDNADAKLVEGATVALEKGFIGFTVDPKKRYPFKEDFVKNFNDIIYAMQQTGEAQKIVDDYINK